MIAGGVYSTLVGVTFHMHGWSPAFAFFGLGLGVFTGGCWFRDITREAVQGAHTSFVKSGLKFGMVLFILREVILFRAVF